MGQALGPLTHAPRRSSKSLMQSAFLKRALVKLLPVRGSYERQSGVRSQEIIMRNALISQQGIGDQFSVAVFVVWSNVAGSAIRANLNRII
jgi:hypothetical protein